MARHRHPEVYLLGGTKGLSDGYDEACAFVARNEGHKVGEISVDDDDAIIEVDDAQENDRSKAITDKRARIEGTAAAAAKVESTALSPAQRKRNERLRTALRGEPFDRFVIEVDYMRECIALECLLAVQGAMAELAAIRARIAEHDAVVRAQLDAEKARKARATFASFFKFEKK